MTTRDPRSSDPPRSAPRVGDGVREPTQSLSLDPGEHAYEHAHGQADPQPDDRVDDPAGLAALARGTHNRPVTRIESPAGRGKTPLPAGARHRTDDSDGYVGAVLGSYRVMEPLGKGGMGYVFRAEHVRLGREVALKLLRSDYASRRDAVARFFQEARTVNRVRHRNIVDVTDFVELDDGTTYIVMELLTGTSLGAWAQDGVDLPRALAVLVQICDGLAAAHQVGVVHRDLKPDNVIVVPTSDGADLVKVLDFGVAKLLSRDDEDVAFQTAAGSVIGTPAYMSPEQAGGMEIDARSDIYSLGAIMYELFSGQPMFRGRSFGEYVRKHLTEVPVPPSQTPGGAGLDPRIEAVILRCLDKDPDQRFPHVLELREALLQLLGGIEVRPELVATLPPGVASLPASPPHPRLPYRPRGATPSDQRSAGSASSSEARRSASGAYAPPLTLSGEHPLAAEPRRAAAPGWVWFLGGAAAVGLGIAAAIWLAGGGDPRLSPTTAHAGSTATAASRDPAAQIAPGARPTAQPIDTPPPRAQLVELRFDSLPSGSVFAGGRSTELCQTPCAFNIDLGDGGPTDRRSFVVKRAGYLDSTVTVDLAGTQREFQVLLQHVPIEPASAARAGSSDGARPADGQDADAKEAKDSPDGQAGADRRVAKHPARPPRRPSRGPTARSTGAPPPATASGSDEASPSSPGDAHPATHPAAHPAADPGSDAAPASPRKPAVPQIDPADTLDPFRRKP